MLLDTKIQKSDPELIEGFKGAMGLLTGGVTIITSGTGDGRRGLTATAVCSLSAVPPMVLISVNRQGEARDAIAKSGYFCVNVLSQDDKGVADSFAGRGGATGAGKFEVGDWGPLVTGAPALSTALVSIDCEVTEKVEAHTHTVFFGHVQGLSFSSATPQGAPRGPLVYWDRLYREIH